MKIVYLSLIFLLWQTKTDPIDKTVGLLRQNNFQELCKTVAPGLELTLLNESNVYTKEQAQVIIDNFFSKNQVLSAKLIHRVDSNPAYEFAVVLLNCKYGNYRASFSLRNNGNSYQIDELRIEEEKMQQ